MRTTLDISPTLTEDEVKELVLALPLVKEHQQDKPLKKFIYVPKRVANVVI